VHTGFAIEHAHHDRPDRRHQPRHWLSVSSAPVPPPRRHRVRRCPTARTCRRLRPRRNGDTSLAAERASAASSHHPTPMRVNDTRRPRRAALAGVIWAALTGCGTVTEAVGRVVDPAGQPVRGALALFRYADRPSRDAPYAERADSAGRFHAILYGGYFPSDALLSVCAPASRRTSGACPAAPRRGTSRSSCARGARRGRSAKCRRASR
jgi:hypothetical protein